MTYVLIIKRQARKILQSLNRPDKNRITEKIMMLKRNPDDVRLDVKHLQGQDYYRLRIGDWRVIYARDDDIKIIAIVKIKPRGGAYK
jgi:mRNA interferase RelE/StbE